MQPCPAILPLGQAVAKRNVHLITLITSGVNVTENEHCACRDAASTAVHDTAVVPTLNVLPEAGVHVTVTGDVPPVTVAGG